MQRRAFLGWAVLAGSVHLLAGCGGWYLRGTRKDVLGVKRVTIETPKRTELYLYFAQQLTYSNVDVTTDLTQTDAVIVLKNERYERRVLSVDPDTGKVREVELTLTLQLSVRAPDGSLIAAPDTFRWVEDFVFDEVSLLGTVEVEQTLRTEMAKSAARGLVLKLETIDFNRQGKRAR